MIPKYLLSELIRQKAILKGMQANPGKWVNQPVTLADVEGSITALEKMSSDIEDAQNALKTAQQTAHDVVDTQAGIADQAELLAIALHQQELPKLNDYSIELPKGNQGAMAVPGKAVISLADDSDGEGFVITIEPLANASDYEIYRTEALNPEDAPPATLIFTYLKSTKKLVTVDDDVIKGKRYYYQARGYNRRGKGDWSNPANRVQ